MRVLVDADPIVYRCGFSAQNDWQIIRWSEVRDPDDPMADIEHMHPCLFKTDRPNDNGYEREGNVVQMVEELGLHEDEYWLDHHVDPLPVAFALHLVKSDLRNIRDAVNGYLAESDEKVDSMELFLSGSTNFRNKVATIRGYKENRKDKLKPHHYAAIREYMVREHGATVYEGLEADDALAIRQWAEDEYDPQTIIATIDKDLKNVPGWQYNYVTKEDYFISSNQAQVNFYQQLLTGDATDNIPGLYRFPKKELDVLIRPEMGEREMYEAVLAEYETRIPRAFAKGHKVENHYRQDMSPAEHLLENARLLWMLQSEDQLWTPPGEPYGSIMNEGFTDDPEEF